LIPLKILAFNASPRKQNGVTDIVLDLFLGSAAEAGANVEKHYVVDLDIKGCLGCFSCWWKTPGKCVHRDDMDWILPKMVEADVLVFGTPIYHYNIIHYLQRLMERTLPLALPEMDLTGDGTHHPGRYRDKPQKIVVAAVCGFPDQYNFNQVRGLFPNAAKMLLPASMMLQNEDGRRYLKGFIEALQKAGKDLVEYGVIKSETQSKLIVEYPPEVKEKIVALYNAYSSKAIPT